jgi:hypothetical protein
LTLPVLPLITRRILDRGADAPAFGHVPVVAHARGQVQVASGDGVAQPVFAEELRVGQVAAVHAEHEAVRVAAGIGDTAHLHPAVLHFVAAVQARAFGHGVVTAEGDAAAAVARHIGLGLGAEREAVGHAEPCPHPQQVAGQLGARGQARGGPWQAALLDDRHAGGRIEHLVAEAERAAARTAANAAAQAQRLVIGPAQRTVGQRAHGLARGAHAGVQREPVAGRPAQAQAGLAAFAAAGVAVFALQAFGVELQVIGQLEAALGIESRHARRSAVRPGC